MNSKEAPFAFKPPYEDLSLAERFIYFRNRRDYLWTFAKNGFHVSSYQSTGEGFRLANGQNILVEPGEIVGEVTFVPLRTEDLAEKYRVIGLSEGIKGMNSFFEFLSYNVSDRYPSPKYLVGKTNKRMAIFAKKFGFVEFINYKPEDEETEFVDLVAKTAEVHRRFCDHQARLFDTGMLEGLHERSDRLRSTIPLREKIVGGMKESLVLIGRNEKNRLVYRFSKQNEV